MSESERQLWRERIARALDELKKETLGADGTAGEARDTRREPPESK
jgi:hypothetical protein